MSSFTCKKNVYTRFIPTHLRNWNYMFIFCAVIWPRRLTSRLTQLIQRRTQSRIYRRVWTEIRGGEASFSRKPNPHPPLWQRQRITNDEEVEKKSSLPSFSSRIFLRVLCYYLIIIIIIITGFVGWGEGEEEEKAYFVNKSRECQVSSVSSGTRSVSHKEKSGKCLSQNEAKKQTFVELLLLPLLIQIFSTAFFTS